MKQLFTVLISALLIISCGTHSGKPKIGSKKVMGVLIDSFGNKQLSLVLLETRDTIKYNSDSTKSTSVRATLIGRPLTDSAGIIRGYALQPSDMVIILSTMDYDSLMRKDTASKFVKKQLPPLLPKDTISLKPDSAK